MTSGRFRDVLGTPPALQWPVVAWKSPAVHSDGTTPLAVPSPIPAHAMLDLAFELRGAGEFNYVPGDITRGQRGRIAGANDWLHLAWYDARRSVMILGGNATNAYYLGNKLTGLYGPATAASWDQRVYAAWPKLRDEAPTGRGDRKHSPSFRKGSQLKILRKRWVSDWVRRASFPLIAAYDVKNASHTDEPAFMQIWARCLDQDQGFQTGDELLLGGDDMGGATNGHVVFWNGPNNQPIVGYTIGSGGPCALSFAGVSGALTPEKWAYQLRIAYASEPDDLVDPRRPRNSGDIIAMHYTPWRLMSGAGQRLEWEIPENFEPIDIGIAMRCRVGASATGGWAQNDIIYSRSGGNLGWTLAPQVLMRGRRAIVQLQTTQAAGISKAGLGATTIPSPDWEFQLRMIG